MKQSIMRLALGLGLIVAADSVLAGTATTTFNVIATVKSACTVSAVQLNFGTFDPSLGTALTGNTSVSVSCTKTTPFTVALNAGVNGTFATRSMKEAGGNLLNYNLYTSAALTSIWGDGTASTSTQTGTGAGVSTPVALTVYGNIPSQPAAVPSVSYSDTITVTVSY